MYKIYLDPSHSTCLTTSRTRQVDIHCSAYTLLGRETLPTIFPLPYVEMNMDFSTFDHFEANYEPHYTKSTLESFEPSWPVGITMPDFQSEDEVMPWIAMLPDYEDRSTLNLNLEFELALSDSTSEEVFDMQPLQSALSVMDSTPQTEDEMSHVHWPYTNEEFEVLEQHWQGVCRTIEELQITEAEGKDAAVSGNVVSRSEVSPPVHSHSDDQNEDVDVDMTTDSLADLSLDPDAGL